MLASLITVQIVTGWGLVLWLVWPSHLPVLTEAGGPLFVTSLVGIFLMVSIELIRMAQGSALWLFSTRAKDPVPLLPQPGLRVAILTTIVPNKEPLELVLQTLRAMKRIEYDGQVDVWLLDEGGDSSIAEACAAIGVEHFSRKGIAAYNTSGGEFKAKTKAGNHNAWRHAHEAKYDVVAQMDPDHVPGSDFLQRSLGYFADPDVGFVVAPQVYGNLHESWIAKGSAVQAYVFHGIIQRGGNGLRAPLLIGTNHLYRPQAFATIGGYQDSIIEDHLTSMAMFSTKNPLSGNYFKGVYTPDILAVGEGPTSFTDYFSQQKRWAYGIWEIMCKHSPKMFGRMRPAQRLSFSLLQLFYPSVAVSWVLGNVLTAVFLLGGSAVRLPVGEWFILWLASMSASLGTFFWLRRFNLAQHEREEWGMVGLGLLLICAPVYVAAAVDYLARRPLAYAVTAKGKLSSGDSIATFRSHVLWLVASVALLTAQLGFGLGRPYPTLTFWLAVTAIICAAPLVLHFRGELRTRGWAHFAGPFTGYRSATVLEHSEWLWWDDENHEEIRGVGAASEARLPARSLEAEQHPVPVSTAASAPRAGARPSWLWWETEASRAGQVVDLGAPRALRELSFAEASVGSTAGSEVISTSSIERQNASWPWHRGDVDNLELSTASAAGSTSHSRS
jgi:cellulose synthase/poly-beta-1,6-N-acetylglucosamine synthase-like glycosyltransferase